MGFENDIREIMELLFRVSVGFTIRAAWRKEKKGAMILKGRNP